MIKVLIIRFSSIGDIVLTTPVVRCLKKQVSDVEIYYLTKKKFAPLLENNPYIDHLVFLEDKFSMIIHYLRHKKIDYIIDLHHNLRSLKVKKELSLPGLSFNKLNFQKWLLVNFKINRLPQLHIVDRYLESARFFELTNDNQGLDFFSPPEFIPENIPADIPEKFVLFSLGATHNTKRLPVEKSINLIKNIKSIVILIGGNDTIEESDIIAQTLNDQVMNLCGKISLFESAKLLEMAQAVITFDTGMMHIAAALRKPIFSIWGNTVPEFGMTPYLPKTQFKLYEVELKCRPCSKIGYKKCPKGHFKCMNGQNTDQISHEINYFLSENKFLKLN